MDNELSDKELSRRFNHKKWLVFAFVGGLLIYLIVLLPYLLQFGKSGWSSNPADFGVLGDYLGGVINPLLTFLTFIFLLVQWSDSQQKELEGLKIQYQMMNLEHKREEQKLEEREIQQFWKELEFALSRIERIQFEDKYGIAAVLAYRYKHKDDNNAAPASFEIPCQAACDYIEILFKSIFSKAIESSSNDIANSLTSKFYSYLKVSITELDIIALTVTVKSFKRQRSSYEFINRVAGDLNKNNILYPELDESERIESILKG